MLMEGMRHIERMDFVLPLTKDAVEEMSKKLSVISIYFTFYYC